MGKGGQRAEPTDRTDSRLQGDGRTENGEWRMENGGTENGGMLEQRKENRLVLDWLTFKYTNLIFLYGLNFKAY